jgi:phosphoribosylamine--glycine ligase
VFHAGTALESGRLVVSGGRVLNVSAVGADLAEARDLAYQAAGLISFAGMQLRTDVGEPVHV